MNGSESGQGAITVRGTLTWGPRPVNKVIKVDVVHKAPGRGLTHSSGGQTQQHHEEAGVVRAHLKCGDTIKIGPSKSHHTLLAHNPSE